METTGKAMRTRADAGWAGQQIPPLVHTHTHTRAHIHTYTHQHIHMHADAHAHTHTHADQHGEEWETVVGTGRGGGARVELQEAEGEGEGRRVPPMKRSREGENEWPEAKARRGTAALSASSSTPRHDTSGGVEEGAEGGGVRGAVRRLRRARTSPLRCPRSHDHNTAADCVLAQPRRT